MLFRTHIAFAVFVYILAFKTGIIHHSFLSLMLILVSAIIPDMDAVNSFTGRRLPAIGRFLAHRGIFHSLLLPIVAVTLISTLSVELGLVFFLGYTSHLLLDSLTPSGVRLFYPLKFRIKGRLATGSLQDKLIFWLFVALNCVGVAL